MNQQERIGIGEMWVAIAQMYGKDLTRQALVLMLDSINDLDPVKVYDVFKQWVNEKKTNSYPLPADIRALVMPSLDPLDKSRLAASRVIEAVNKFGYTSPFEAREFIGELGWQAINNFGGWDYVCGNLGHVIDVTTFNAQIRDICVSVLKSQTTGQLNQPIAIDSPKENKILDLTTKLVESKKIPQ